ncbi:hypothetical protein F0U60_11750 [Archangium minus]|uniref:HNH nuclease domain-containing protein n=1 Tax=Archangium minus TaxID=83450 RepID=A0ABY9WM33_9BACT|nr:hypothetical protein F0U60_11750 [Archangium minus]
MAVVFRGRRVRLETGAPAPEIPRWEPPPDPCAHCGKDKKSHPSMEGGGTSVDSSIALARNILRDASREQHPWYTGVFSLAAHHLICGEAMDDEFWPEVCSRFSYSINHANNGVMLPHDMELACQLGVPVHRGSHKAGHANEPSLSYPDGVKYKLRELEERVRSGEFCMKPGRVRALLDRLSRDILREVSAFRWTLTWDGEDYGPGGAGCGGVKSLRAKKEANEQNKNPCCPHQRRHGLRHARTNKELPPHDMPLELGK